MKMRLLVFNISNYLWVQNATEVMLHSWCWWSWVVLGHQNQGGQIWELIGERRQNLSGLVFFLFWFSFLMSVVFYAIPPPNAAKKKTQTKTQKTEGGVHLLLMQPTLWFCQSISKCIWKDALLILTTLFSSWPLAIL